MSKRKPITAEVDEDIAEALAKRARDADRSLSAEVRRILTAALRGEQQAA